MARTDKEKRNSIVEVGEEREHKEIYNDIER